MNLVIIKDPRHSKKIIFLKNLEVNSFLHATGVVGYCLERWGKEEGYRFTKSFLNYENIRTLNWKSTQALGILIHLVYIFITRAYKSMSEQLELICE